MGFDNPLQTFTDFTSIVNPVDDAVTHLCGSIHGRLNSRLVWHKAHKSITSLAQSLAINNRLLNGYVFDGTEHPEKNAEGLIVDHQVRNSGIEG